MFAELVWVVPFILLLGSIAVFPLLAKHWWEKNYPYVSLLLGAIVVSHYLFGLKNSEALVHTAHEYFSFIALIGSLFVVAGGIHINVKGEATPPVNCVFLLIGSVLANLLGTTGASMVLVRPWIRMNKYRLTAFHIVFFIFIVSNVGGGLTPIGDPPLFLGYLKGVPFFWVMKNVWQIWFLEIAILLAIFFVLDQKNFLKAPREVRLLETAHEEWKFLGAHNVFFLLSILGSVFINDPIFLREGLMIAAAVLSYRTTPRDVHESNDFNFGPIKEVAILFLGIFSTMIPALEWLEHHAAQVGIRTAGQFFWASGTLSSVLDNAPTYLNFLSAAIGLFADPGLVTDQQKVFGILQNHAQYLRAISVGSVFFGAVTYIGNGPNFLVKSIADQSKVKTPTFFGYFLKYSVPVLIPSFGVIWYFFFR